MDLYHQMAHELPNDVRLGGAFLTMVEPDVGFEQEWNRWYEDDHFYAGVMQGPWWFAGRRWVAPRRLREIRLPADSPIARPLTVGCYIATYFMTAGHELDAERWLHEVMAGSLMPAGRGLSDPPDDEGGPFRPRGRTHVYTFFHHHRFAVTRDAGPMQAHHALDHPFRGLVVEVLEHPTSAADLATWLRDEHLPAVIADSPAGMVLGLEAVPFSQGMNPVVLVQPDGAGRRLCLMWFLDESPEDIFPAALGAHHAGLDAAGVGLLLSAPFLPTIPGTDRYVDELR